MGPFEGILAAGLDPELRRPDLTEAEIADLVDFVENALFDSQDPRVRNLAPASVPSGMSVVAFEGCGNPGHW